jgi:hypothetical protein
VASAASALGNLRRALREFLDAAGGDPQLKAAAGDVRSLDARLGQASREGDRGAPSPGERAAGHDQPPDRGGQQDSPGRRAAFGGFPSRADSQQQRASAKAEARTQMGVSPDGAKGPGSNLPPFLRRKGMKGRATARGGP